MDFDTTISISTWPSKKYYIDMALDLGYPESLFHGNSGLKQAQLKEEIEQDYAKVDVYYKTLNVKKIRQLPAISVTIFYKILVLGIIKKFNDVLF